MLLQNQHGKIPCMFAGSTNRPLLVRWGPAFLILAVIFLFSAIPSQALPVFGRHDLLVKKFSHAAGYALLAASLLWGLGRNGLKAFALAWLLAVLYAFSDELHQAFVPGRMASLVDVAIDAAGAGLGLLAYYAIWFWASGRRT